MGERTECMQALEDVIRRIGRQYRQRLDGDSVTFGQFAILRTLAQEGPMAMGEVARNLGVSLAGATGLIDRLVHADMVKRYRSEADRRVVWVDLSEHGVLEYERLENDRSRYFDRVFSALDDERIGQLRDILGVIGAGLDTDGAEADRVDSAAMKV